MWFSTASIITACCASGTGTCMRRARPMAGCGMSPSPAISLEVSTTTTRLPSSSASTRATSRSIVVLPTPGRPRRRIDSPASITSRRMSTVPIDGPAHPAGEADHVADPVADGGDAVERALDAGAVVLAEAADPLDHVGQILAGDRHARDVLAALGEPHLGHPAQVEDDLDQAVLVRMGRDRLLHPRRHHRQQQLQVVGFGPCHARHAVLLGKGYTVSEQERCLEPWGRHPGRL